MHILLFIFFISFSFTIFFVYVNNFNSRIIDYTTYIWEKKYIIKSFQKCNITLKVFPNYNFSLYIRTSNDFISNILRNGKIYNDCINLFKIWFNTSPNVNDVFVDAGANIGTCSLFLMNYGIKTIAFEPVIDNLYIFTTSLLNKKYMLRLITLYKLGLGSKKEIKKIHCYAKNMGSSSLINKENSSYTLEVYIDRLDSVIDIYKRIHLLKIDVEGYEFEVIKGSQILLEKKTIDYIYMEINCSILNVDPIAIYNYLETYNYTSKNKYYCRKSRRIGNVIFYRRDLKPIIIK